MGCVSSHTVYWGTVGHPTRVPEVVNPRHNQGIETSRVTWSTRITSILALMGHGIVVAAVPLIPSCTRRDGGHCPLAHPYHYVAYGGQG